MHLENQEKTSFSGGDKMYSINSSTVQNKWLLYLLVTFFKVRRSRKSPKWRVSLYVFWGKRFWWAPEAQDSGNSVHHIWELTIEKFDTKLKLKQKLQYTSTFSFTIPNYLTLTVSWFFYYLMNNDSQMLSWCAKAQYDAYNWIYIINAF